MKMSFFNGVTAIGYVSNFVIRKLNSGTLMANITVRDELNNNQCYVTLFDHENMRYGDNSVTMMGLRSILVDSEGNPRHVLVRIKGRSSENKYISKKSGREVVSNNITVSSIAPESDPAKQKIVFNFSGVVDNISESTDGNEMKIRLGFIRSNRDGEYLGMDFNEVVARGDVKEQLEDKDIERRSLVRVSGVILNKREYDYYENFKGTVREMRVEQVNSVVSPDDVDDIENYDMYKSGKKSENVPFEETKSVASTSMSKSDEELLAELGM